MKNLYFKSTLVIISVLLVTANYSIGQITAQINQTDGYDYAAGTSPFRGYYEDARNQILFTAAELSAAGMQANCEISSLGFYIYATNSSAIYSNFEVKLGHTPISSIYKIAYVAPSDHTTVFSGSVSNKGLAGTWVTINFTTPFIYNGIDNLIIETCFDNSTWSDDDLVAYSVDLDYYSAYSYNDGTAGCSDAAEYTNMYRPCVQLTWTDLTPSSNYYVSTSGNNSNDGSSGSPWLTLSYAISQVIHGDVIKISAGIYTDNDITLSKRITIIGSGANGPSKVIFQGDGTKPFMYITGSNITIKNLTIDGYAEDDGVGVKQGGTAIEIARSKTGIEFENVVFSNNSSNFGSSDDGGAVFIALGCDVDFKRCVFHNNSVGPASSSTNGYYGAAIRMDSEGGGTTNIYSCLFYENNTAKYGSSISSYGTSTNNMVTVNIYNSTFADNLSYYSSNYSGPIYARYSIFYLKNCAFANNTNNGGSGTPYEAYGYGGTKEMHNCITTKAGTYDYGFANTNCANSATSGFSDATNDDYSIISSSSFVNGGNNAYWPAVGDMNTGSYQTTADAGCYEYCGSATWDGSTDTDFSTAANWNTNHPGCNDLTIANVTNDPVLGDNDVTVNGSLTILSGGSLTVNSSLNGAYLEVKGNFSNSGTFTHSGSAPLKFTGSTEQTINTGGATLKNVEINNSSGVKLLSNKATISGTLTLTSGGINTNGNILELTSETASDFSGYSSTNFIRAISASGALRLHIDNDGTSSETYTYPVGLGAGSSNYYRLDLVNSNLTGNGFDYLDVYIKSNAETGNNVSSRGASTQNGTALSYYSQQEWVISPDAEPSGGTFGLKLYTANVVLGASGTLADNKFTIVKRSTASEDFADYDSFDGITTIPAAGQDGRTTASGFAQKLGFTDFSKTGVGGSNVPLPIELTDFTAEINDDKDLVDLSWTTASEINNDFFSVERSQDALDFDIVVTVPGAGNSNEMLYYETTDKDPLLGVSYYRLKQTDYDGKFTYSKIVAVKNLNDLNFSVMPNPTTERLTLTFGKVEGSTVFVMTPEYKAAIKIFNTEGKLVYRKKFDGTFYKFTIDVSPLPEGMYYVNLKANDQVYKSSFLKQ